MYTNNRNAYRQTFYEAWQKHQKKLPLEAVETQLIKVILQHPEYQRFLENMDAMQQQEFALEENPFFHMSLHLAIHEQVLMDRPAGIKQIHHELINKHVDIHEVEHLMMDCLAKMIWQAQQTGIMASDADYLAGLRAL